ncbi:hypothetical protein GDO78_005200 [Eleutherodactylus coqui]|uniref:Uncharacterized protein n=1 Tax=Eleutherodactylus coqui TaxID=57060 RepID=A0A8J6KCN4_ELECQ|nr:hypothetical protein GDO78_005200 [Eleutherodactylus coqui]
MCVGYFLVFLRFLSALNVILFVKGGGSAMDTRHKRLYQIEDGSSPTGALDLQVSSSYRLGWEHYGRCFKLLGFILIYNSLPPCF